MKCERETETKTIRELCELVVDCPHSTPTWTSQGKIVVRNNNIKNGRIDLSSPSYTDEEHYKQRTKRAVPRPGDIIITREAPIGEVGMIPDGVECCLGQRMVLLRPNPDICNNYYLLYSLQSRFVQHQISWSEGTGTTVSNLRIPHLEQIKIPYLPLEEQEKIASTLRVLDEKINLNRGINANLQQQAQAIFKSWFVDFEPFQNGEFVESELGPIPKGWRVGTVGENYILNPETYSPKESWKLVNYLDTSSITKGVIGEIQEIDTTTQKLPSRARRKVKTGDIVYSTVRPNQKHYGMLFDVPEKFLVSTGFVTIRETCKSCSNYYLYMILTAQNTEDMLQQIAETSTSTFPAIRSDDISNLSILIPEENVGGQFRDVVEPLFQCVAHNMRENQRLAQLRDTLLPKLMNGEIDISGI